MNFDPAILAKLTKPVDVTGYVRIIPTIYASTPLDMGFGKTRFASPRRKFKILYLARDLMTAIAETIIRDRFQGKAHRKVAEEEFGERSILEIVSGGALACLDLRGAAANLLNVPTDAVHAKNQAAGRAFSQRVFDETSVDGLIYASRITGDDCVAIYDRAVHKLAPSPVVGLTKLASLPACVTALHITVVQAA